MKTSTLLRSLCVAVSLVAAQEEPSGQWPPTTSGAYSISNFAFDNGDTLPNLDLHYQTIGELKLSEDGSTNAVLILHGSSLGSSSQFLNEDFASVLFNPGQILDAEKYFLILPDQMGHGESSTPRNTGLHADFPGYQYSDMVRATHRLLTEHLSVNSTRLTMGVSMGGMHTWMFGEEYPDFSEALMPIACLPKEIAGHNRLWRKMFIELIRLDPAWQKGEYEEQPIVSLTGAMALLQIMNEGQASLQREYPTRESTDAFYEEAYAGLLANINEYDVNNQIFAWNASYTYNPEPYLSKIRVPLTAVNTEDDLMNPPELEILEDAVQNKMRNGLGKAVIIPQSKKTFGHASYIAANLWKQELQALLERTE